MEGEGEPGEGERLEEIRRRGKRLDDVERMLQCCRPGGELLGSIPGMGWGSGEGEGIE